MKRAIASFLLCGALMRLAVVSGAEESIRTWAAGLEPGSAPAVAAESPDTARNGEYGETVGETNLVFRDFTGESGEYALSAGERAEAEEKPVISFGSGLDIRNDSSLAVDIESLTAEPMEPFLSPEGPHVLIIHTHGSEAYSPSPGFCYEESDPYRTGDKDMNVIEVGDVLAQRLEAGGLRVIHDREIYDYPSYTGSYSRSGAAVEKYLEEYPEIAVVIDLHRDALGSGDTVYKTRAETESGDCAQIMILVGTGENGLSHPLWQQNLRLGLYLQSAAEERHPSLMRPLVLKSERYNQHLSPGALILEVGSTGNTLPEAVAATELFGDCMARALAKLISDE